MDFKVFVKDTPLVCRRSSFEQVFAREMARQKYGLNKSRTLARMVK